MKKVYISLLLLVSCSGAFGKVGEWVEKKVGQFKEGVEKVKQNPKKFALFLVNEHFKLVGINVNGIVSNVNSIQTSIATIKKDTELVQQSLRAPRSPVSKAGSIAQKMNKFQTNAQTLMRTVQMKPMTTALASSSGLSQVVQQLVSTRIQTDLRSLYGSYTALISEIDSMETRPILQHTRKTLYDAAGLLDAILQMGSYSGKLVTVIFLPKQAAAIRAVSTNLRNVAKNVNNLAQDGLIRPLMPVQAELATKIISNLNNVQKLTASFQGSAKAILPKMNKISTELTQMAKAKNKLIVSSSAIKARLLRSIERQLIPSSPTITIKPLYVGPGFVAKELKTIITDMRTNLNAVLNHTTAVLGYTADVITMASDGVNSFKKYIKFDLVTPRARGALDELPKNVRALAKSVDVLRKMIP